MKNLVAILFFFGQIIFAQDLVPATSEDQEAFNQQLEQAEKQHAEIKQKRLDAGSVATSGKSRNSEFGQSVAGEARKLKDSGVAVRKGMGSAVSALKRKNKVQTQAPIDGTASSNGSSVGKDGRNSSPRLNNTGGAPSQPGQSGNRSNNKLK